MTYEWKSMERKVQCDRPLKLFNAVNAGAEPRVGHPTHNCYFCLFFLDKKCIYSVAERLYENIKRETFQTRSSVTSAAGARRTSAETSAL